MKMCKFAAVIVLALFAVTVTAQVPDAEKVDSAEKLRGLEFMVGEWEGTGWIQIGRERKTFNARESLSKKLNGSLIVVEGIGKNTDETTGKEKVVHSAFGIFYYDLESKKVIFRYFKADGPAGVTEPAFSENKVEWGFVSEPSKAEIKFTEHLDEDGNWVETGEVKPRGSDRWIQFFFMKLRKITDQ